MPTISQGVAENNFITLDTSYIILKILEALGEEDEIKTQHYEELSRHQQMD